MKLQTEEVGVDGTDKTLSKIGSVDGKGTLRTAPVANEEFGAGGTTFACLNRVRNQGDHFGREVVGHQLPALPLHSCVRR